MNFRKLAEWYAERYTLSAWYDVDDLAQDIALAAFEEGQKHDEERGLGFDAFVIQRVKWATTKRLSKVFGVSQHTRDLTPFRKAG